MADNNADPLAQAKADAKIAEQLRTQKPAAEPTPPEEVMANIGGAAVEMTNAQRGTQFIREVLDRAGLDASHDTLFAGPIYQHLNEMAAKNQTVDTDTVVNAVKLQARQMRGLKRIVPKAQWEANKRAETMSDTAWRDHMQAQRRGR